MHWKRRPTRSRPWPERDRQESDNGLEERLMSTISRRRGQAALGNRKSKADAGVVGMGLMGTSIATCLLAAGHQMLCVEPNAEKFRTASARLMRLLKDASRTGLLSDLPEQVIERARI